MNFPDFAPPTSPHYVCPPTPHRLRVSSPRLSPSSQTGSPAPLRERNIQPLLRKRNLFDSTSDPFGLPFTANLEDLPTVRNKSNHQFKKNYEKSGSLLTFRNETYRLTELLKSGDRYKYSHVVYRVEREGKQFIAKFYDHKMTKDKLTIARAHAECLQYAQEFIQRHPLPGVSLVEVYSDSKEDGFELCQYVEGSNSFFREWENKNNLSESDKRILGIARNVIETMWRNRTEGFVDFRPENVILTDKGDLVVIDYTADLDKTDLILNLRSDIKNWAKNNPAALEFLYENLKECQPRE